MPFKQTEWITHPAYGSGQIQELNDKKYVIRFVDTGTKDIILGFALTPGEPPHPDFKFPAAPKPSKGALNPKSKTLRAAFTFEHMVEKFDAAFSKGFDDPEYLTGPHSERDYKVAASERFTSELGEETFKSMLEAGRFAEVCATAISIATSHGMNLVNPRFEMPKLQRALKQPAAEEKFAHALFDVLYGSDDSGTRFDRYVSALGELDASTWSLATIFQFIRTKGALMFMKISVSELAADAVGIDLMRNPKTAPSSVSMAQLNKTAAEIQSRLKALGYNVRDGIDVQSFMFVAWDQLVGEPAKARKQQRATASE